MIKTTLQTLFMAMIMATSVTLSYSQAVFSTRISTGSDDMEEELATGNADNGSSDLEFLQESTSNPASGQIIGLRFNNVSIPQGSIITDARIQFQVDETKTLDPSNIYFKVQTDDNPPTFSAAANDVSGRPVSSDSVLWSPPVWTNVGDQGPDQRTTNLGVLVQQIVNRPGWVAGNSIVFIVTGEGTRCAESYDGTSSAAPELTVEYFTRNTLEIPVSAGLDDMEENIASGNHDINSSDLELIQESTSDPLTKQLVGIRFANVMLDSGTQILSAKIQFTKDNTKELNPCNIYIKAEDTANASGFSDTITFELMNRPKSNDSVLWVAPTWAGQPNGTRGADQLTSDFSNLVQQIVNRPDWARGNGMAFYLTGEGTREAESFEGAGANTQQRPTLIIEYVGLPPQFAPIGAFPIAEGAVWNYWADSVDPSGNWTDVSYNDSSWAFGPAQLGYGDGDESTLLDFGSDANNKWPSYYFRHKFEYFPGPIADDSVIFYVKRDDGAVIYLNGTEVARTNMPAGAVSYGTLALSAVGGSDEDSLYRFSAPASLLNTGLNVFAASVHQNNGSSSDLSFDFKADAKKPPLAPATFPLGKFTAWKFSDEGVEPAGWNLAPFDDSQWDYGFAPLGYGDPVATTLDFGPDPNNKYIAYYLRKEIDIPSLTSLPDTLEFGVRADDGAVVYVNGTEVIRDNMPTGTIGNNTTAVVAQGGTDETNYVPYLLPKTVFNQGINLIAVSLHQAGPTSSDTQFDLTIGAPKVPNDTALGCNGPTDVHIGCFTSVEPASQTSDLIIPSTHRMQKIIEQGDNYTKNNPNIPWTTVPGNNDFTAYVGRNGSNIDGVVAINHENGTGGVSIADVRYDSINRKWTIDTTQAVDFYNNDLVTTQRNCSGGISPWGTIMTCEETFSAGDNNADGYQDVGWIVEIDPWTKKVKEYGNGKQEKLWAMGRMSHENVCFSDSSTAYFAEDGGTSCVYKFVADNPADMTSGTLYVLVLDGPLLAGEPASPTGTWVQVPNTTQADRNNTNSIAAALGGTNFSGPEDVEVGTLDGKIYFAAKGLGRTYRFTDNGSGISGFETFVGGDSYLINHGTGVTSEPWGGGNDNLTFDDRGNLYVLQDGGRDHLWMVRPNHTQLNPEVELFIRTPSGSEPCGFQFTHDYRFGFLSIQHPSSSNNSTFQLDVNGDTLYFDRSTTVAIARQEFLNENAIVIGIEQQWLAEEFELNVYPNPSSDQFNVKFNLEEGGDVRGEVRDLRGHNVRIMETQYFEKGENELRVPVSDLRAGLYIMILEIQGKAVIQKLIVE